MERVRNIVYMLLALIPIGAVLFVLATIHWLLLLLGLVVTLLGVLVLQRMGMIAPLKRKEAPQPDVPLPPPSVQSKHQVYMVLADSYSIDAERILVNQEHFTIGREPDNDFVIDVGRVSRHHLQIDYDPDENACYVTDNGSRNGTFLNGRRLTKGERCKLLQGDDLMIDDRSFNVQYAHY